MTPTTSSPVLAACDLDMWGDFVIREADRWARETRAPLIVLHCPAPTAPAIPWAYTTEHQRAHADEAPREVWEALQARVAAITGRSPRDFTALVIPGAPHAEIVRAAEAQRAGLVVVGARARSALTQLLVGRTAARVARHAHCPVLVARASPRTDRVLLATDMSKAGLPAERAAVAVAQRRGAKLTAVHVVDTGLPFPVELGTSFDAPTAARLREAAHEQLRSHLDDLGIDAEARIADGPVVTALDDAARQLAADLVVVGTIGRTGVARLLLGSVAESVLRELPCSVLVVRA